MKVDCSTKLLEMIQNSSSNNLNLRFIDDSAKHPSNVFESYFLFRKVNKSLLSVRRKIASLFTLFSKETRLFGFFTFVTCDKQSYFNCFNKSLLRVVYHTLFQFRAKIVSNSNAKANIDGFKKMCFLQGDSRMKSVLYFVALCILLANCHSKNVEKQKVNPTNQLFEVLGYKIPGEKFDKYLVYLKTASPYSSNAKILIEECWVECEGKRIDFAPISIETRQEYAVDVPAWLFNIETKRQIDKKSCGKVHIIANRAQYDLEVIFKETKEKFEAIPQILTLNDSLFAFVLDLIRFKPIEEEYFPSSERLRIELSNNLGKTIWNSSYDLNFLQIIAQVEPIEVGKAHRYFVPWNRRDNNGKFVEEGEINVAYILPTKPSNILKNIKLELKKDKK